MNKINKNRTDRMREKSLAELKEIADRKTLSSAAAKYEIRRRANS